MLPTIDSNLSMIAHQSLCDCVDLQWVSIDLIVRGSGSSIRDGRQQAQQYQQILLRVRIDK